MAEEGAESVAADTFRPAALAALSAFPIEPDALDLVSLAENVTYRVVDRRDGVAYALRLHRPWYHTLDELISERVWIRALADAGIAVQAPLRTRDGQEYAAVTVPGTGERRFAGLARWTTGRVLAEVLRETTDTASPSAISRSSAPSRRRCTTRPRHGSLRRRSRGMRWTPTASWATRRTGDRSGITGAVRRGAPADARHAAAAACRPRPAGPTPSAWSMIHDDMHPGNVLVDGDRLTVIDFDDAAWGWHDYDIAVALVHQQDGPNLAALERAYVAGYRSVRPISDQSLRLVPMFRLVRALAQIGWYHQRPELNRSARFDEMKAGVLEQCLSFGRTL